MDNRKKIILYWVLLIIPSAIIVAVSFKLIRHEQERINQSALASLNDRSTAISEYIQIMIMDVETELTESLFNIPQNAVKRTMLVWAETNPLVRNVFICDDTRRRPVYPTGGKESTNEERLFLKRYEILFLGKVPWESDKNSSLNELMTPEKKISASAKAKTEKRNFVKDVGRFNKESLKLRDLAKIKNFPSDPSVQSTQEEPQSEHAPAFQKQSGWTPWFTENRLCLIGWVRTQPNGPVYGVELELITILSRLITRLPKLNTPDSAYALIDGNNEIFHQSGTFPIDINKSPVLVIPLTDVLPHWRINVYQKGDGFKKNNGFLYMASLLLALFIIAILSGGIMLTRETQRNVKDALEKTSFVSSVSHELKTPLTSIRMYAELLQSGRVTKTEKVSHYLSVIVTESQRLTRLVNNILDFGRLEEGKKKYRDDTFDIGELLHEIADTHIIRIETSGLKPEVLIPDNKMPVTTDRDAIEQVVLNLIDNTIKYAASGEKILLMINDIDTDFFKLSVCDYGPGIPLDQREKIFEKFHRIDNSLTSKQPGSGLGLSIARRILRDLGGDLLYEPSETYGSCFIIKIRKKA